MRLVNTKKLATIMGFAPKTIHDWVAKGLIPYYKPGSEYIRGKGELRFDLDEIELWLKTRRFTPPGK